MSDLEATARRAAGCFAEDEAIDFFKMLLDAIKWDSEETRRKLAEYLAGARFGGTMKLAKNRIRISPHRKLEYQIEDIFREFIKSCLEQR